MKTTLTILFALILISCETEEITQEPCICNNAKFFIPSTDNKSEIDPPPLGLNYIFVPNCELDCETGLPLTYPTEHARYIGCE